ncbi:MAG: translesion error-prone DNA polymerase V subunit UmuC [Proteobacteria bacterium]|nr:translesion error-prone DNA polymerase V subunit UmuC [Gammaproteobacteria bacterium]NBW84239.1 translesion error-prone DNA polymerase V subunit UmuC [Pseudomonadota bacterium]
MKLLALVDCDNFYASCERVFRPDLKQTPIVVLSNNDGCVIARSKEAKAMGIKMGIPWFKVKKSYLAQGGKVFSSNFALYGDLSKRVMNILEGMVKKIEVYSIDEAFLDLQHIQNANHAHDFGVYCRNTIRQWVGIPVRIGIAPTKTLTKIASHVAKNINGSMGVCCLNDQKNIVRILKNLPIKEVWGIGHNLSRQLNQLGIYSAYELMQMDIRYIRKKFSVVLERTVRELRGEPCIQIEDQCNPKKQIIVSRSFRNRIESLSALKPVISNFAVRAGEKLRQEKQKCSQVSVFISTSRFNQRLQYRGFDSFQLPCPVDDTRSILMGANKILNTIFRKGYPYAKAGILLSHFSDSTFLQKSLFEAPDQDHYKQDTNLMQTVDTLNSIQTQVYYASQYPARLSPIQKEMVSPKYTTNWWELPITK